MTNHPDDDSDRNPFLKDPERPIYVVCTLMQELKPDITNAGPLTKNQSQMAFAVAHYAGVVAEIALGGIAEIGKLMAEASFLEIDVMPPLGRVIQHLSVEAQFMLEAAADYRDAANQPCRD